LRKEKDMKIYAMEFIATETLQNGKERRCKRTVYCHPFRSCEGSQKHYGETERIADAQRELMSRHYYGISYLGTRVKDIMTIGEDNG
jgi:hypothetical protein